MDARNDLYRGRWRGLCHAAITQTEICKSTWFDCGGNAYRENRNLANYGRGVFGRRRSCVPVGCKSDLAGLAKSGSADFKLHYAFTSRAAKIGFHDYSYSDFPVVFWDLFGAQGHPVRTTVAEMGPLLLSRLLELTEAQEGILNIAFRIADEQGYPLLDLKDLQSVLVWLGENRADVSLRYGNISVASIGAIQGRLMVLEIRGQRICLGNLR